MVVRTTLYETRKFPSENPYGSISSHHCNGPNHFAKDCILEGGNPGYDGTSVM